MIPPPVHPMFLADVRKRAVDPNSATLMANFFGRGGLKWPNLTTNRWSVAYNAAHDADPCWHFPNRPQLDSCVPIPSGTKPSPDDDGHLSIYDASRLRMHELYGAVNADGWTCKWGVSYPATQLPPAGQGVNAADLPQVGLAVRPDEIQAGTIDHALLVAIPRCAPSYRFPAQHTDGQGDAQDLPQGAWLAIDPNLDLTTLGLPAWELTVGRAMKKRGVLVGDTGGSCSVLGLNPVNQDPGWWAKVIPGATGGSVGFSARFPWHALRVLETPRATP